jgi:MoxR-like ATPase
MTIGARTDPGTADHGASELDEAATVTVSNNQPTSEPSSSELDDAIVVARQLHVALSQVVLGSPRAVTFAVVAALSGNHLLIEDVPGVGKTLLARALATCLGVPMARVQGHPDLLPSDITGVTVYSPDTGTWEFRPGPIFAPVVLLDELNRTPPRTQSALLEAMEEGQVSVDGESWALPRPHLVIGTQNPIGQLGTYPLVESQLDRFGVSTSIGYPDAEVETRLVLHGGGRNALASLAPVADALRWERAITTTGRIRVESSVAEYAVALVRSTRSTGTVRLGASPRASISLIACAQAYAVLNGRTYTTPSDVQAVAVACLAHRLVAEGTGAEGPALVARVIAETPAPST